MKIEVPLDDSRLDYEAPHCWQYQIRLQNFDKDLIESGLSIEEVSKLRARDFEFSVSSDIKACTRFIEKHEWLGKVPPKISHRFVATYKGRLAGVLLFSTPNQWSRKLVDVFELERLVSRGACISWSPKNLGSRFLMWSLRWLVANTPYRIFTGYSDPRAKELGTIYQSCNFLYMGKKFGADRLYLDLEEPERGWFSERKFSTFHQISKYARQLGIVWDASWNERTHIFWEKMPDKDVLLLKRYQDFHKLNCLVKQIPLKHKYIIALGHTKKEERYLNKLILKTFPDLTKKYPKHRSITPP